MRILHICNDYFGTKLYNMLFESIQNFGIKNLIYVPLKNNSITKDLCKPENVTYSKCFNSLERAFFLHKEKKILKDILEKYSFENIDIIHAHTLFSNGYIAYKLNQKYNIPYIVAVRNTDVNIFLKRMIHLRKLGVDILNNASKVIFISKPYMDIVISKYIPKQYRNSIIEKSVVITNGIDDFWLNNIECKYKNSDKNIIKLIYVGSINKNKNIVTTVKACKKLIEKNYKLSYRIVGKIINNRYKKVIKNNSFIKHNNYSSKEEILEYFKDSDIFIMPSIHETFGLTYAEAMSQGLPIIYTRGQGFDGQFEEGTVGYSVNCFDENEIVDKLEMILKDYHAISMRCVENASRFKWSEISLKYKDIYESLIN